MRPGQRAGEILLVEAIEDGSQVDMAALGASRPAEPASIVARSPRPLLNVVGQDEHPVYAVIRRVDFLPIELCQENQRERTVISFRNLWYWPIID